MYTEKVEKILLILLAIAAIVIAYLLATRGKTPFSGQSQRKEANKEKITATLLNKPSVTNNDVEELLGVSDATATRYLNELEQEGRIQQIGKTGRGVEYILK